jgi:hypothetical protein
MVSMLLMILILGTMTLTMMDTRLTMDNARNKKTFQAADSGIRQGRKVLSGALSDWTIPAATTPEDVEQYAADAETGIADGEDENNTDISVVADLADRSNEILPRNDWMTSWQTESSENQNDMQVWYDAAYDVWPAQVDYPAAGDFSYRHTFHYDYAITSRGSANISAESNKATRMERGSFSVQVERPNFATYGYFTNSMKNQFDDQLWFFEGEVYGGKTRVNVAPPDGRCAFWGRSTFNGPFEAVQATYEESAFGGNPDPQFNGQIRSRRRRTAGRSYGPRSATMSTSRIRPSRLTTTCATTWGCRKMVRMSQRACITPPTAIKAATSPAACL